MIRVLMAEDHSVLREGMKRLFALSGDISVSQEAVNGAQVLEMVGRGGFDLLLLGMSMPGNSGVELIARVRAHSPGLPILVLSMHNEVQIARRTLDAGAWGYLTKDCEAEIILEAVREVAAGKRYIDPVLREQMA